CVLLSYCSCVRLTSPSLVLNTRPPRSTLFPYTTLFRSACAGATPSPSTGGTVFWCCSSAPTGKTARSWTSASRPATSSSRCAGRSEEHTSELQSRFDLVCRLLLEKKKQTRDRERTTKKT